MLLCSAYVVFTEQVGRAPTRTVRGRPGGDLKLKREVSMFGGMVQEVFVFPLCSYHLVPCLSTHLWLPTCTREIRTTACLLVLSFFPGVWKRSVGSPNGCRDGASSSHIKHCRGNGGNPTIPNVTTSKTRVAEVLSSLTNP